MTEHVSDLLSPYLDGQVTEGERSEVESHLAGCAACRAELVELRAVSGLLRFLPAHETPRSFALGPRALRPSALNGTWDGALRFSTSIAAALAILAVSFSLLFQGFPRQAPEVAAGQPFGASGAEVRAAQPAASRAAAAAPQPKPAASLGATAAAVAKPAAGAQAQAPAQPAASAAPAYAAPASPAAKAAPPSVSPAPVTAPATPAVNVPRLAGELLVLFAALSLGIYSLRWWR